MIVSSTLRSFPAGAAAGKVVLLGAGPGDPSLITLRGARALGEADVIFHDALVHPEVLRWASPGAECRFVGKRAGQAGISQEDINRLIIDAARAGKRVVRLKGGDPFLFGRGSEEAEALADAGVPFEVIPGVPSPVAVTAYAGISLTHRFLSSSVAYVTARESTDKANSSLDWSRLAVATETLVIFMGLTKLSSLMDELMAHGRGGNTPAAVIQWASLPRQRVVTGTVADIADRALSAGLGTPSLVVVGNVVRLRSRLRWFEGQPLFGKRVLVTRPEEYADSFCEKLRRRGAEPVRSPLIAFEPPDDPASTWARLQRLGSYDWVLFTSQTGVNRTFDILYDHGRDARTFGDTRVGAIGPATAGALRSHGLRADVVAKRYVAEGLLDALREGGGDLRGARVLLPRASEAREVIPTTLREAGATVDVVPVYRTVPLNHVDRDLCGSAQVITFTASSTVHSVVRALGGDHGAVLEELTVASIGPITSGSLKEYGVRVDVEAKVHTEDGLVEALENHFLALGAR